MGVIIKSPGNQIFLFGSYFVQGIWLMCFALPLPVSLSLMGLFSLYNSIVTFYIANSPRIQAWISCLQKGLFSKFNNYVEADG